MYDAASLSETPTHQRATGNLRVSLRERDGATVLYGLRQEGCLKARFPRPETAGWLSLVTLNTSGGIAGGDRLDSSFQVQPQARATIAAQAAERFYRSLPGGAPSVVRNRIEVADGAAAEWLPQETILFDRCAADRRLEVTLGADAWFLGVECLVFGRAAMGEVVEQASLRDVFVVRRAGRLLWHDAIRMDGSVAAALQRPAIAAGARAVATIVHVARDAEDALEAVRQALTPLPQAGEVGARSAAGEGATPRPCDRPPAAAQSSASAWNGMLIARILAPDGASIRQALLPTLQVLRGPRPLPRVWLC